jgi:hypothetical protein
VEAAETIPSNQRRIPFLHPTREPHRLLTSGAESTRRGSNPMKNVLWMVGGFSAAAVGFLVWGSKRTPPVELLAHRLERAWADHHTVVETN